MNEQRTGQASADVEAQTIGILHNRTNATVPRVNQRFKGHLFVEQQLLANEEFLLVQINQVHHDALALQQVADFVDHQVDGLGGKKRTECQR